MLNNMLEAKCLSKSYTIYQKDNIATDSFFGKILYGFQNWLKRIFTLSTVSGNSHKEILWALKNITFSVKEGEMLGIIGKNGSGKSTLLKIISRITYPTSGKLILRGKVSSILQAGAGFHGELTGRENIYLNASILGMNNLEIKNKFDQIVDFSGVEKFIDTPLKRYSSGMIVRLAFAISAHIEPDILVVDEAFAVGDLVFQQKCLNKLHEIARKDKRSVLFVSHNMNIIKNICSRLIFLEYGEIKADGTCQDVINKYIETQKKSENHNCSNYKIKENLNLIAQILYIELLNKNQELTTKFYLFDKIYIRILYVIRSKLSKGLIVIDINNNEINRIFSTSDIEFNSKLYKIRECSYYQAIIPLPVGLFPPKEYNISVRIETPEHYPYVLQDLHNKLQFEVISDSNVKCVINSFGMIRSNVNWKIETIYDKKIKKYLI